MRGYLFAAKILLLAAVGAGGFWLGWKAQAGAVERLKADARVADERARTALAEAEARAGRVSERVVVRYLKAAAEVREVTKEVIREVPVYISAEADAGCDLPAGAVWLHDKAACGRPLPDAAGGAAEAPSGLALSAYTETVAENYGSCHECAARLTALQEWVIAQAAAR